MFNFYIIPLNCWLGTPLTLSVFTEAFNFLISSNSIIIFALIHFEFDVIYSLCRINMLCTASFLICFRLFLFQSIYIYQFKAIFASFVHVFYYYIFALSLSWHLSDIILNGCAGCSSTSQSDLMYVVPHHFSLHVRYYVKYLRSKVPF